MPYLSKYHLREQEAYALLGPLCATLRELERRAQHYVDRLHLAPTDQEAIRAAHQAIAAAHAEVERLWQAGAAGGPRQVGSNPGGRANG